MYIIFTVDEIMEALGCAEQKAIKLLSELDTKAGLIERKRQGLGKPNLIYVKNFISGLPKSQGSNTDINNTEMSDTDLFFSADSRSEEMRTRASYEEYFRDALEIDFLKQSNPGERDILDGILDLIVDTCCANKP